MKSTIQISTLFLFILLSCGTQDNKNNADSSVSIDELRNIRYQEVMAIHDEVMPKLQDIISLQENFKIRIDSLTEIDSTLAVLEELNNLNNDLAGADKSMMDWMHQFNSKINSNDVSDEVAMTYLEEQKVKILEVKERMNNSINSATEYFESHQ